MKLISIFILTFFISFYVSSQDKRLALVIGNAAYEHGAVLNNPVNDADLMASTLENLGFTVIKETDANLKAMQSAFMQFVSKLNDHDVALFFYAGHGMQVNGENYLLPVDSKAESAMSLEFEAFEVSDVNKYFAANRDNMNIMILDACRDNPYRSWSRGGDRGFKAITNQGAGTIVAFATTEGQTASDGTGSNGLYTKYLVQEMAVSQNITEVFQNTRIKVLQASDNKQVPQEWNMLTENFSFKKGVLKNQAISSTRINQKMNNDVNDVVSNDVNKSNVGPSLGSSVSTIIKKVDEVKTFGTIEITTKEGGMLYLDGKLLGPLDKNSITPINNVPTGDHELELRGEKYDNTMVRVIENKTTYLKLPLIIEIGDHNKGGIIVYILQPGEVGYEPNFPHGLIISEFDLGIANWNNAIKICRELSLGGFDDWALPSKENLQKLKLLEETKLALPNKFYWSSTEVLSKSVFAINLKSGLNQKQSKSSVNSIRAIRSF